jgi:hypothetical protein
MQLAPRRAQLHSALGRVLLLLAARRADLQVVLRRAQLQSARLVALHRLRQWVALPEALLLVAPHRAQQGP